ncbi:MULTISPECIES: GntT/GntP/DsdX family permease [Peribacillus]|uniref:GntT/GntP/DsdX family permease n=2 Tax=Peribacillus TaxID=2675229 RepID=UPI003D9FD907
MTESGIEFSSQMNGFDAFFIKILLLLIVSHNNGLLLIVIIAKAKWSPLIALLLASIILGIIAGMDIPDVADAVQIGIGNTLR